MSNLKEINNYFIKKLANLPVSAKTSVFDEFAKKSSCLTELGIDSNKKFRKYFLIKKAAKNLTAKLADEEKKKLLNLDINNLNDAYYSVINIKLRGSGLRKIAYSNVGGFDEEVAEEFDVNKWLKVVHLIYDSVAKKQMTKLNALDYYSNLLDIERDEDLKFKKWFKYYSDGEHLKYSSKKDQSMKKESVYIGDLGQGNSPYSSSYNMPGDSFGASTFDGVLSDAQRQVQDGDRFDSWKSKLHTAIRRIDKLLRTDKYIDSETYRVLAEHLMNLSLQVHILKLSSTLSDVTYKTANAFTKLGHIEGADALKKLAQEAPEQPMPEAELPPEPPPAVQPAGLPQEEGAEAAQPPGAVGEEEGHQAPEEAAEEQPAGPAAGIPDSDDVEPVKLKDIIPIPGARQGEYSELAGELSVEDAAHKLDEVAGMLADRRIIRQLAEFDIMLDKIGIASMFPELAESQSKLIDAFSYALTRVTKMMGQLANAKLLADSQTSIPGAPPEAAEEAAPEAAEEAAPEAAEEAAPEELGLPE